VFFSFFLGFSRYISKQVIKEKMVDVEKQTAEEREAKSQTLVAGVQVLRGEASFGRWRVDCVSQRSRIG